MSGIDLSAYDREGLTAFEAGWLRSILERLLEDAADRTESARSLGVLDAALAARRTELDQQHGVPSAGATPTGCPHSLMRTPETCMDCPHPTGDHGLAGCVHVVGDGEHADFCGCSVPGGA